MRKNFGAKPFLYPQPVMILGTYDENGKANAMNAAYLLFHRYRWISDPAAEFKNRSLQNRRGNSTRRIYH